MKTTINLAMGTDERQPDFYHPIEASVVGGLAIHRHVRAAAACAHDTFFVLTHVPSGRRIDYGGRMTFQRALAAARCRRQLLALTDWSAVTSEAVRQMIELGAHIREVAMALERE